MLRPASAATRRAPGPGEVEVRVRATGLNFRDVLNAMGLYPGTEVGPVTAETYARPGDPGPIGGDCAGVVVALGEGVASGSAASRRHARMMTRWLAVVLAPAGTR